MKQDIDEKLTEKKLKKEKRKRLPNYSRGEEIFNAVTHIVGGGFGIVALVLGTVFAAIQGNAINVISMIIYGVSMILLYTMSAIYHFLRPNRAKRVFRIFDHCTIYFLIAGTYTPICLIALNEGSTGIILLSIVWVAAIIGITFNAINMYWEAVKIVSMILYLAMGWCVIFTLKPLLDAIGIAGFIWLIAGGIAYTIGAIIYGMGKKKKWMHSIWHLFVLLGSILQFVCIFFYVLL